MILEFKTSNKNTYGRRNYLYIDTATGVFCRNCPRMVVDGIEIKTRDYKTLIDQLKRDGLREVDHI